MSIEKFTELQFPIELFCSNCVASKMLFTNVSRRLDSVMISAHKSCDCSSVSLRFFNVCEFKRIAAMGVFNSCVTASKKFFSFWARFKSCQTFFLIHQIPKNKSRRKTPPSPTIINILFRRALAGRGAPSALRCCK